MFKKNNTYKGVIAIPVILMISGLIVEIVIVSAVSVYVMNNSQLGIKLSTEAFFAAQSGIQDSLLKIARNKDFNSDFSLSVGDNSAEITVCKDICVGLGKYKISSIGKAGTYGRKLEAILSVDSVIGEIMIESLKEVEL
ncbi:MAG: hypothetical protein A3I89_02285 [Candidatus Harrisonbacteria bacterium RIFCSPLOWO2_02_FULL_41_11]|uniref:Uncharacterized protein n=1 Tax=Candidatus Harrisonbacteria bacterium RIFCSPHIGHO2_02_FULL_42_16 TaxID=1798404 RepID=A0A1G1ZI90_9BACT|nr:MAG: hypothetical protein A3B92_03575 [Candidatus Harrisonbacteria bacterium RIFCSPHIGHO2_02_FULL_42_16]OGY66620.1 MAG: hypothetical protein A3I89_02285 [Candidatus Harrisonbacteria bacterium RIFCSPLOWO2_02_FULL_41_11]